MYSDAHDNGSVFPPAMYCVAGSTCFGPTFDRTSHTAARSTVVSLPSLNLQRNVSHFPFLKAPANAYTSLRLSLDTLVWYLFTPNFAWIRMPTRNSFSTTMNALVRAGKCDGALAVFREMISRKLEPGLVACNFVLTNCSKHKQGEVALEFLEVMRKVSEGTDSMDIYIYVIINSNNNNFLLLFFTYVNMFFFFEVYTKVVTFFKNIGTAILPAAWYLVVFLFMYLYCQVLFLFICVVIRDGRRVENHRTSEVTR